MPLNPKRVLTRAGKTIVLAGLNTDDPQSLLFEQKAFAVLDVVIDPINDNVTEVTAGLRGLQTGQMIGGQSGVFSNGTGKVFSACPTLVFSLTSAGEAQTVKGLLIGPDTVPANALAYLELDEPVTLDEQSEALTCCIEVGFDRMTWYIRPRVLPVGT